MRIIPHKSRLKEMKKAVERLQDEWRWCTACGKVEIDPDMPSYAFKCKPCWSLWKSTERLGEIKVVQEEGYRPASAAPGRKRIRLSSEGMSRYCTKCGGEIDGQRLHFALFISAGKREASKCTACAKGYKQPLDEHKPKCRQVFVPDEWIPFAEDILPAFQTSLL